MISSPLKKIAFALFLLVLLQNSYADEMRPAYLELRQISADTFSVLWKVPARDGNQRLALDLIFADDVSYLNEPHIVFINNAFIQRGIIKHSAGLAGSRITIGGLKNSATDAIVRVEYLNNNSQMLRLSSSLSSFVVEATPSSLDITYSYLLLGAEHILAGIDHLLFVLALLLIVNQRWWILFKTITAFTLAHSITLALATLNLVQVASAPVEAVIALSIVFAAAEILRSQSGNTSLTLRKPWLMAFGFGLLHGFGFAGALSEVGLPQHAIPLALLFFNIGVELGQLLFVAGVTFCMIMIKHLTFRQPAWSNKLLPYAIGSWAACWAIERSLLLF
jgi:hypothetical protein